MNNKIDKETEEHKIFYEKFLIYTTYSTVIIIAFLLFITLL